MFSKDDEGCISAEELKFVMTHLPGKVEKMMVMVLCAFAGELKLVMTKKLYPGDVQGDRRDDPHGGQERGREDQLQ